MAETSEQPKAPHVGMQTVTFVCAKGDRFIVHGHTDHGQHGHEIRKTREEVKRGCPVMKLRPGRASPSPCGAKVTEETVDHAGGGGGASPSPFEDASA